MRHVRLTAGAPDEPDEDDLDRSRRPGSTRHADRPPRRLDGTGTFHGMF